MNKTSFHIVLGLILATLISSATVAQDISIDRENSRLWIEGSSNVNRFECRADRYNTQVEPPTDSSTVLVEVDVVVEGFDCGKRRMNRDLYETLLSNRHPHISFEYLNTESIVYSEATDLYTLIVNGKLTVAGHTNNIRFPLTATVVENGRIRANGKTDLKMSEYKVDPPSALLGLVRVNDELTVHFELFAILNNLALPQYGEDQK